MNSNGIPEMILAAGRSRYVTPRIEWWRWLIIGFMTGVFLNSCPMHVHASPCMTFHQAREVWPTSYLAWHGDHCWYAKAHVSSAHAEMRRVPLPRARPEGMPTDWIYSDWWWLS